MPRTGKSLRRVTLLVAGWNQYGRGIIEGVWQYSKEHGPWLLDVEPSTQDGRTTVPTDWRGDGLIVQIHTMELFQGIEAFGVPMVNVSGTRLPGVDVPRVSSDPIAVVKMALCYLQGNGHKTIAFCGRPRRHFADYWRDAYTDVAKDFGLKALIYSPVQALSKNPSREEIRFDLRLWLQGLPKPLAVIGWDTVTCRNLAMACDLSGLDVPADVTIISLSTDDLLAKVVHPPISGVDIPVEKIGYEAARMLDRVMAGEKVENPELRVAPLGVTARQSSDVLRIDDPHVRKAMAFIRDYAHTGISVQDILKEVPLARRTLERRFKEIMGRGPAQEIRRTKIERVRQLLGETEMFIPDIAEACGFKYVEHMIPVFKKYFGCTPLAYRKRARPRRT